MAISLSNAVSVENFLSFQTPLPMPAAATSFYWFFLPV
jgi:hypothetical protein